MAKKSNKINESNQLYDKVCYSNNGLSMRHVSSDYVTKDDEVLFDNIATPEQLSSAFDGYKNESNKISILEQINELENKQSKRLIREAALGKDGGKLDSLNSKIEALRQKL